ncbi:aminoacyl tRNA synthase complex-interacting multifunctional protein 1-like isoform X2 [Littorina saxatilis]|uniref:tRNA-binding domain-containing protein n=1 Tax=Littorina saxatilis TaxID=31220 RepID=A0AAN9B279_9CAEN
MAIRMASATVLKGLKLRADQADGIIAQLKHQIAALQTATALSAGKGEEEQLREKNNALQDEIETVKISLKVAEIRNGVKQIGVPQRRGITTSAGQRGAGGDKAAQAPPPQAAKATDQPQAKKAKTEAGQAKDAGQAKQDKEKPAKDNKSKGKKAEAGAGEAEKMDVSRLDFRVGKIVAVEKHPDADTLYVETVDLGEEKPRTIVSGLVNHIPIEQMQDRVAVFMCNLKASKMRGVSSEGMIMCAKDGKIEILEPPPGVIPGDRVTFDGYPGTPDKQLNPKKKVWETLKPDIRTNKERVATFKGVPFKVEGKGIVKAPTLADAEIS